MIQKDGPTSQFICISVYKGVEGILKHLLSTKVESETAVTTTRWSTCGEGQKKMSGIQTLTMQSSKSYSPCCLRRLT